MSAEIIDPSADILPFTPAPRPVALQRQPEVVANLLLLLEDEPLFPPSVWSSRDDQGRAFVGVRHAGVTLRFDPEDACFAARCLIAEQAFPACVEIACRLRDAANGASAEVVRLHAGLLAPPAPIPPRQNTGGRTMLFLSVLGLFILALSTLDRLP